MSAGPEVAWATVRPPSSVSDPYQVIGHVTGTKSLIVVAVAVNKSEAGNESTDYEHVSDDIRTYHVRMLCLLFTSFPTSASNICRDKQARYNYGL